MPAELKSAKFRFFTFFDKIGKKFAAARPVGEYQPENTAHR
jgi:hypothetical protein